MRAVVFMLERVFSGICRRRVLSPVILCCLMVSSNATSINVGGSLCGTTVSQRNRVFQGGDELEFRSLAWSELYETIQRAGVVHPEINFLPVTKGALQAFGMTPARFQTLRNKLHTTMGGALYDLVLSTTARHVGMRMGEFNAAGEYKYNARAGEIFYLAHAAAPGSETPGSPAWWGSELFGIFPNFRFLVDKCISPPIGDVEVDPEVCMAREMLSSFGKLAPLLDHRSFETVFFNTLSRHDGRGSNVPGRVQFILRETFQRDNYPAAAYHTVDYTRVKAQPEDDVVLPLPTFYIPAEELRRFHGVFISRTEINDATAETFNVNGAPMRQIGVAISVGAVEGAKLRELLNGLQKALHPSSGVVRTVSIPR